MAINDISLTAGMRTNLTALQTTVSLLNRTQERLSTGKKVNNALDNPLNFFTAQALNSRANDLAGFKDAMSEAVQTINAANNGITAISGLIAQAKAIAASAKTTSTLTTNNNETLTVSAAMTIGDVVTVGGFTFTAVASNATAGTTQFNIESTTDQTAINLFNAISSQAALSSGSLNSINVVGNAPTGSVITLQSSATGLTATDIAANNIASLTFVGTMANGTFITVGGLTFGFVAGSTATTNIDITANTTAAAQATALAAKINALSTNTGSATEYTNGISVIQDSGAGVLKLNSLTFNITASGAVSSTAVVISGTSAQSGTVTNTVGSGTEGTIGAGSSGDRLNYYAQYTSILSQIDLLAGDSNYKGTNLLGNNNLDVSFGTSVSDKLTVQGFDGTAKGADLKMTATSQWLTNSAIDTDMTAMDTATNTLKAKSSSLASGLSIVNTRQDWVNSMVTTLTQGADNLTLADMNEEGANMLMLQTRQALGTTALSLSSQAAQSVLKLFA